MWNWFKRKPTPKPPSLREVTIAELPVPSGTILLDDPMNFYNPARVDGIPPGHVRVVVCFLRYGEGAERVAKVTLHFGGGEVDSRQVLGNVDVDSASVVVVDSQVYENCWQRVGKERIGLACTPSEHRKVARLIEKRFGIRSQAISFMHSRFLEPISEELEEQILAYLETFPDYESVPEMYFRVETKNTSERIAEALCEQSWAAMALEGMPEASLLAFSSGFGDGSYAVEGLYSAGKLMAVEIQFIGPDQDKILEAFPILRYGKRGKPEA